jgi:hypothetical protein
MACPLHQGANNQHRSDDTNAKTETKMTEMITKNETCRQHPTTRSSILGANLQPNAGFQEAVEEIEEMAKKRKTMMELQN